MELKTLEKLEKNKSSLKSRITFFFVFFLAAVFAVFIITSVLQVNTVAQFICSKYALPTIEKAREIIDPELFEQLSITLDPDDPYYVETQQKLLEIKIEANCKYLYTMAQEEGTEFKYIIDGSDEPGGEDFSELGDIEDIGLWEKAAMKAFTTGESQIGTLEQLEDWGATITAYEPIINKAGEVIGILACDLDASDIVEWIRTQVLWQIGIVALLIIVGLAVYTTLIKKVNQTFGLIIGEEGE